MQMRICSGPGCLRTVDDAVKLCDECKPIQSNDAADDGIRSHTLSDRERYAAVYSSPRWQRVRAQVIKRNPLCARCDLRISIIGDHIVPAGVALVQAQMSGAYPLDKLAGFFLMSNLQGLCRECHWVKTNEDKAHVGPWPDVVETERAAPKRRFTF